jgi:SAM-dependent methyltransferase
MSSELEARIRACYSTWSHTYFDEYYGEGAPYPPVHRELLKELLRDAGATSVLDAGCGPASFLRDLVDSDLRLAGFDVTPEMVAEARRVLGERFGLAPPTTQRSASASCRTLSRLPTPS